MKLIIGLGNPGREYTFTRHNVGFMVIEEVAMANSIKWKSSRRFKALKGEGKIGPERCYLAMPQTFMNLSGNSARSLVNWLKIDLKHVLIVVDDAALPFGEIRLRTKGSDAGHKGLRSIIDCLGTNEFARMRIGIMGQGQSKDLSEHVLSGFTKKEQKSLPDILKHSSLACECWVENGIDAAMNQYNVKLKAKNAK